MEKKKILFFIADQVPTKEEQEEAEKIGTKAFRCARFVGKHSPIEKADGYFGAVPPEYQHLVVKVQNVEKAKEKEEVKKEEVKEEKEVKKEAKEKKVVWTPNN